MAEPTSDLDRKEIFVAIVSAQDSGLSVAKSREQVATQFSLTTEAVVEIERAGIAAKWPPLDGAG